MIHQSKKWYTDENIDQILINEGRYLANKKFTDRIVYKEIFWNEVNSNEFESFQNIA